MNTFEGKIALVTGGARGLGAAVAVALAQKGADVAISYVSAPDQADDVVSKISAVGRGGLAIRSDQGVPTNAKSLVDGVVSQLGGLDILVNNAGIGIHGVMADDPDLDATALDRQWHVNVLGAIATTRAASQKMSDGGRIVFVGSGFGTRISSAGVADYAGTKTAIVGYAKAVARDLGPRNITVNVVQPGIMPTDMAAPLLANIPDAVMDMHAIRRIATLEEVAEAICFLAGPNAGYITGAVLDISGGYQI